MAGEWREAGLDALETSMRNFEVKKVNDRAVKIMVASVHGKYSIEPAFKNETTYIVYGSGDIIISTRIVPRKGLPDLARLGLQMSLPEGFDYFTWYGRGPHENYSDRRESTMVGVYSGTVQEQFENYIFPQENGNKTDLRWAAVTNIKGMGLLVVGQSLFEASVQHYSTENLTRARHTYDLKRLPETILNVDYRQSGLGSHSCGPKPLPQYLLKAEEINFTVRLRGFAEDLSTPTSLSKIWPEPI